MSKMTLARLLIKVKSIPPLPQGIAQILELTKSDKSFAHDLTKVCERDPKLTTNMLKLEILLVMVFPGRYQQYLTQ
tara:strand:+ start:953 stop:1180 length:228 start_codon:yes stop_codon:yes gene_type:complete